MTKASVGIVHHFFPHYRDPVLRELLSSSQYEYWFLSDRNDPIDDGIRGGDIITHPHFVDAPCHFWGRLMFQQGVLRLALRKDIDAIVYMGEVHFISTWLSAMLARVTGKKVYFWTHGWTHADSWINNIIRCTFYRLGNGGLMLYGPRARQFGIEKGFDPDRLYVIYNSQDYEQSRRVRMEVEPSELESVRRANFINPDLPLVICSSRLIKARRLDVLLDALGILKSRGYQVNAFVVGGGSEKEVLERKAHDMALSVKFLGECYDEKVLARLFMASNVTVVPGYIGLTAMHSLGYGIPVITNDRPELNAPEWEAVQPGVNGDLYRYGDANDLAEKIYHWTKLKDVEKAELSARCIRSIEKHYTPQAQREAIEFALAGEPASALAT
jgi:glycosyltransferase involved in cell wall biosynthesis